MICAMNNLLSGRRGSKATGKIVLDNAPNVTHAMGMKTTLAQQVVEGLRIDVDRDVVRVNDGADCWLCSRTEWDAAIDRLSKLAAIEDCSDFDGSKLAYDRLCSEVGGPIASVIGSSNGDFRPLVREAVSLGWIDVETAMSAYGVALPGKIG
jgi:hypothetical protein